MWDLSSRREAQQIECHANTIEFAPDGSSFVVVGCLPGLAVYDAHSGRCLREFKGRPWDLHAVFSPDGLDLAAVGHSRWMFTGDSTNPVHRFNLATGRQRRPLVGHTAEVGVLAYSPDGTRLASGSADRTVRVWDLATREEIARLPHRGRVQGLDFSSDGRTLATAGGRDVNLWNIDPFRKQYILKGHTRTVRWLAFTLNGQLLASAAEDGTVRLWDAITGTELAALDWQVGPLYTVAFAPDGMTAATAGERGDIVVWDVDV
jgi:WD40 repeat protein